MSIFDPDIDDSPPSGLVSSYSRFNYVRAINPRKRQGSITRGAFSSRPSRQRVSSVFPPPLFNSSLFCRAPSHRCWPPRPPRLPRPARRPPRRPRRLPPTRPLLQRRGAWSRFAARRGVGPTRDPLLNGIGLRLEREPINSTGREFCAKSIFRSRSGSSLPTIIDAHRSCPFCRPPRASAGTPLALCDLTFMPSPASMRPPPASPSHAALHLHPICLYLISSLHSKPPRPPRYRRIQPDMSPFPVRCHLRQSAPFTVL